RPDRRSAVTPVKEFPMLDLTRRRPTIRRRGLVATMVATLALTLGACGSADTPGSAAADAGDPVSGGTVRVVQGGEPRSLDPAALVNAWVSNSLIGNALYGTLLVNDPETL